MSDPSIAPTGVPLENPSETPQKEEKKPIQSDEAEAPITGHPFASFIVNLPTAPTGSTPETREQRKKKRKRERKKKLQTI